MLENPYFAAPSSVPDNPGVYRGEGQMEEAEDGRSISIWWESSFAEAMELNLRIQKRLGVWKVIRRSQIALLLCAAVLLLLAFLLRCELEQVLLSLLIILSVSFILLALIRPLRFKQSLKKIVIQARGGEGTIQVRLQIEPAGVRLVVVDMETVFYWRSIAEIEVSNTGVTFIRHLPGFAQVPARVFPDQAALERFVQLSQRYLSPSGN